MSFSMNICRRLNAMVLGLLICALWIFPEDNGGNFRVKVPLFESSPKIDGKLENPLWENGAILETFTQYEPQEGAQPSEKTVAYVGYDEDNLYIGVRCFDSNPKAVRACLTQRDKVYGDDEVTVYLDTFNDKKRAFAFQVNPCGVQSDGIYTETRRRRPGMGFDRIDKNWDTFFLTDAHMDDQGYTVEMAIPFKSLRFPNSNPQTWGFQIVRNIRRKNEEIYWYPRSRDVDGLLIQTGTIELDGNISQGKNIEIMPVATGLKLSDQKFEPEVGLNFKYGITSDLTADLTMNPDFSQVEADMPQIDVNQRYPLYYPEKRPFFLEGKDVFDTPMELVYTRTIANPQWGLKLTGKTGKTTLGFLSAYDESSPEIDLSYGSEDEDEDPESTRGLVNIFRLKRDLYTESYIGFILTDKETGDSWNTLTSNHNRVVGVDGHFKFNNYYRFSFQVLGSMSKLGAEKTGLVPAMAFNISRNSRHVQLSAEYTSLPPDFEAAAGYLRRKDYRNFETRLSYTFLPQTNLIVDIRPSIQYRRTYDFENTLTDEEIRVGWFVSGWRGSHFWGGYTYELERYEGIDFYRKSFMTSFGSQPLSWLNGNIRVSFGDGIYYSENPYLGYKTSYELRLILSPLTNLRIYYEFQNDTFSKTRGGERVYSVNILTQRIGYQITRNLSLRLITDYNDDDKELFNSFLLSYEYRPGTVFYVGVNDNRSRGPAGAFVNEGQTYFIKFSYWWRI